jgi:hypothetical protein
MTGNVSKYLGLVHFYHQGATGSFQYCRNVKAHVVFNNVSGTGNMFIFDHEYPAGTIPSTTIRSFEQITLTGSITGGSFGGRIISNPSVSTANSNLVNVSSTLAAYQNMSALPGYFKVVDAAQVTPPAPAPAPTPSSTTSPVTSTAPATSTNTSSAPATTSTPSLAC